MRVVLANDGSAGAVQATALADAIAWPSHTILRVISVIEPVAMPISGPWTSGVAPAPELDASISGHFEELNADVVERLAAPGRDVEGTVVRGRPASAIVDEARDFGADLVIVGSRGHGTIASLLLGSVSSEVVDQASCPVLVARAPTISRVVLATDGSPSARAAEAILADWSIFDTLPIRVVSVADVVPAWATGLAPTLHRHLLDTNAADRRQARAEHEGIAAAAVARLRERGATVDAEMRTGDPAAEIIAVAEERTADIIVLGSRGRTGLTRLLLGSVARNVLSGSSASVLIVREGTGPAGAAPGGS